MSLLLVFNARHLAATLIPDLDWLSIALYDRDDMDLYGANNIN